MAAIAADPKSILSTLEVLAKTFEDLHIPSLSDEVRAEAQSRFDAAKQEALNLLDHRFCGFGHQTHHMSDYDLESYHVHFMVDYKLHTFVGSESLESVLKDVHWLPEQTANEWRFWLNGESRAEFVAWKAAEAASLALADELGEAKAERAAAAKPLYYGVGDLVVAKKDFKAKDKSTGKFVTHSKGLIGKAIWVGDDSYNPGQKRTGFQLANGVVIYTAYGNLVKAGTLDKYNEYLVVSERVNKLAEAAEKVIKAHHEALAAHEAKMPTKVVEAINRVLEHHKAA